MTKEQAKTASEVMLAYSNGAQIDRRERGTDGPWNEKFDVCEFDWMRFDYRVHLDQEGAGTGCHTCPCPGCLCGRYNAENFLWDLKHHGPHVYDKERKRYMLPIQIESDHAVFGGDYKDISYAQLWNDRYRWEDGVECSKTIREAVFGLYK